MKSSYRNGLFIFAAFVTAVVLLKAMPAHLEALRTAMPAMLLFGALMLFSDIFAVPVGAGWVSLQPMSTLSAMLVIGPYPTILLSFITTLIHGAIRYRWAEALEENLEPGILGVMGITAFNAVMIPAATYIANVAYANQGGIVPLERTPIQTWPALFVLCATYIVINYALMTLFFALHGRAALQNHLRTMPRALLYEAPPLFMVPLSTLIYNRLGWLNFTIYGALLATASLFTRNLERATRRLQRRVRELDSLQIIGTALSSSLELPTILEAIRTQVERLMPADNFFIALYESETDEVVFPLYIEEGKPIQRPARRSGHGLTEYILRTRRPLLIQGEPDLPELREVGIRQLGRRSSCWLGVPILAGNEILGVIAVQSYENTHAYDRSHQDVLTTIAAQAAVAIKNAQLYQRTDEALARRVQELASILRTTQEGILLLSADLEVRAANRAVAEFLGVGQDDLLGRKPAMPVKGRQETLSEIIGYTVDAFYDDCYALASSPGLTRKIIFNPPLQPERTLERILTPVRSTQGQITGWLLLFHDLTENVRAERLREELINMLVHDLRAPLAVVRGCLEMLEGTLPVTQEPDTGRLLAMAQRNIEQLFGMIDTLLDIHRLESGRLTITPTPIEARDLLQDVVEHLRGAAEKANITLTLDVAPDLPILLVDVDLMRRVVRNLLDNAIKFTPDDGSVRVWARRSADGRQVELGVSDTGPGIPPEAQARLFKKFEQVISKGGRRRGTGLGLPFCKLAVEAHGGAIRVESAPGQGSTFIITLPAED